MEMTEKVQNSGIDATEIPPSEQQQTYEDPPTANWKTTMKTLNDNAYDLTLELGWLAELLQVRLQLFSGEECAYEHILEVSPPELKGNSIYADFIRHYELNFTERLTLLLALTPHIHPALLSDFFKKLEAMTRIPAAIHHEYLPTGETLAFILAAESLKGRFSLSFLFSHDHLFARQGILGLAAAGEHRPRLNGLLRIAHEYVDYFTTGQRSLPDFGPDFPARHITTKLDWEDLVLPDYTIKQLEEIALWMVHGHTLLDDWGLRKNIRPGYRALFYGKPGTGKSMTACLLGKSHGKPVYKIDLSLIVSKYIGETTKNLAKVFDQAEKRDWILFFDEADALFGKRTKVEDAHDRHANQEVAYLLQRIEHYEGIVLLASNLKDNLDDAFARRFESVIHFPIPQPRERLRLWKQGFSPASRIEKDISLRQLSEQHEMSGGAIMNVIRYASLMALQRTSNTIILQDLKDGIKKEFRKEGKTMN